MCLLPSSCLSAIRVRTNSRGSLQFELFTLQFTGLGTGRSATVVGLFKFSLCLCHRNDLFCLRFGNASRGLYRQLPVNESRQKHSVRATLTLPTNVTFARRLLLSELREVLAWYRRPLQFRAATVRKRTPGLYRTQGKNPSLGSRLAAGCLLRKTNEFLWVTR